jgi:hypothetical protein
MYFFWQGIFWLIFALLLLLNLFMIYKKQQHEKYLHAVIPDEQQYRNVMDRLRTYVKNQRFYSKRVPVIFLILLLLLTFVCGMLITMLFIPTWFSYAVRADVFTIVWSFWTFTLATIFLLIVAVYTGVRLYVVSSVLNYLKKHENVYYPTDWHFNEVYDKTYLVMFKRIYIVTLALLLAMAVSTMFLGRSSIMLMQVTMMY